MFESEYRNDKKSFVIPFKSAAFVNVSSNYDIKIISMCVYKFSCKLWSVKLIFLRIVTVICGIGNTFWMHIKQINNSFHLLMFWTGHQSFRPCLVKNKNYIKFVITTFIVLQYARILDWINCLFNEKQK